MALRENGVDLEEACRQGMTEIVKLLLERGAEVDMQRADGWSALKSVCRNGHPQAAKLLLDRGAEVDLHDTDGWTPLMLACKEGHKETAELLLDRGAKVDLQQAYGWTPLMFACEEGHKEIAELLLDRGAKVDLHRSDDFTPLMLACEGGHKETAKLLLDRGAEGNLQNADGWSALMAACHSGHPEVAELLLDRGAEVDLQKTNGWTALMSACRHGNTEAVNLLLDRGAEVDLQKTNGWTALMSACRHGNTEAAKLLLDRGAKVDLEDSEGNTALAWATRPQCSYLAQAELEERSVSIIKLLCTRGDRLSFADLGGPAALAHARRNRLLASADLLEFLGESSPLAPYGLPIKTLASLYAHNVRTPPAAADLSGAELFFMGLKDTGQRREVMERLRAAAKDEQTGGDTLEALALKIENARDAHKRGQDAIDCNLEDLSGLLSSRPCQLAASYDFDVAMNTVRKAKRRLEDLHARVADDVNLVAERDEARDKLASLMTTTISGAFHCSIQRLEKNDDPAMAENICSRVWACLSDEPLADPNDPSPSDQDTKRACRAAKAAIATWKQREEVILAQDETVAAVDKLNAAAQALGPEQTWFLMLSHPTRVQKLASELKAVRDAFDRELRALRDDNPMDETPLAEIRCALELIVNRCAETRQIELARCRTAADAVKIEVDELVRSCSKPSITAVEDLLDRIEEVQAKQDELRHAQRKRRRSGGVANADMIAKLEDELASLPSVYELDHNLRQERARVIRHAERYSSSLMKDPAWRKQIGLSSEELLGVGKLKLWLASVTRADFLEVKALATRPGKVLYKVTDPDDRVKVLKSFHLANVSWQGRFCRQVQALAELKSAYFVYVEALFVDGPFGCILMPYYEGGDLAAWIRDNPHASDETRKRIAAGVLSGVHDLHQRNLVHCDIKPENIFLTQALTPVLGDFDGIQMSDVTMTQPLSTARYVAPELRSDGVSKVAPAVDLYSVGVVLSEIFPAPSAALQALIDKLRAGDPTQRPSALEALRHEAFHTRSKRSCKCPLCLESYPETEGLCCESDHFVCKTCLGDNVRAAAQSGADVQLKRDCSMLCVAPGCEYELSASDLAMAVPDEFETVLKIVRKHFELETAADAEKELQRRVNVKLRERGVDTALDEHVRHIKNKILTLSCPRCETAFADFDGCCALKCSNPRCKCYFCAWCLQSSRNSDTCHAHVTRCRKRPPDSKDLDGGDYSVVNRAWIQFRTKRLCKYVDERVTLADLKEVLEKIKPDLTEDVVGPDFKF